MKTGKYQRTKPPWNKNKKNPYSKEALMKMVRTRVPLETRSCECHCGETFECKVTSKRRFIKGHWSRTKEAGDSRRGGKRTKETRMKMRKAHLGKKASLETKRKMTKENKRRWKDLEYRDKLITAIIKGRNVSPNNPEKFLFSIIDKLFPNDYSLNVKGEHIRLNGKLPDIVNINGQKKCIELFGDYWHADSEFCNRKGITEVQGIPLQDIRKRDKKRLDSFRKLGWSPLVIWYHELMDVPKLECKLMEFHKECPV